MVLEPAAGKKQVPCSAVFGSGRCNERAVSACLSADRGHDQHKRVPMIVGCNRGETLTFARAGEKISDTGTEDADLGIIVSTRMFALFRTVRIVQYICMSLTVTSREKIISVPICKHGKINICFSNTCGFLTAAVVRLRCFAIRCMFLVRRRPDTCRREVTVRGMRKQFLFGLAAVFIWSTMAAVVKSVVSDIPNMEVLAVCSLIAAVFLLIVNAAGNHLRHLREYSRKDFLVISGLGFLGMFLYSATYYLGLSQLSSQEACVLNYLWPAMLVIFSTILLKEHLTAKMIIAMLCSFAGVIVLSLGGGSGSGNRLLGMTGCILAAVFYGLFSVLNKKWDYDQRLSMMLIWFTTFVCASLVCTVTRQWVPVPGESWIGLLWIGIMINGMAYLCWALAIRGNGSTAAIANLAYLTPFLSLIVSAVFLHEKIEIQAAAALFLIIGGILIQNMPGRRPKMQIPAGQR